FDGKRFVNPSGSAGQPFSAVPRMLLEPRTPWPVRIDEAPRRPPELEGADAVVSFIGHSTFLIQTAAGHILTDPMYSQRAGPLDRNRALWGGFVLAAAGARIFFAGDTGYAPFFRDVRRRFGPIDLALLPIGAYEPRWFMQPIHMNPAEAVRAHLDLEASESIGMHFGTFQLTTEGIDEPLRALEDTRRAQNIPPSQFRTLGFGESMRLAAP